MPFYHFPQNNTGGDFIFTDELTHHMVIEAASPEEANRLGLEIGMYFNGCQDGRDCRCCGDRWYPLTAEEKGDTEPMIYEIPVASITDGFNYDNNEIKKWGPNDFPDIYVFRKGVLKPEGYLREKRIGW